MPSCSGVSPALFSPLLMFGHFSGKETDKKLHKNVRLERTSEGVGNGMTQSRLMS